MNHPNPSRVRKRFLILPDARAVALFCIVAVAIVWAQLSLASPAFRFELYCKPSELAAALKDRIPRGASKAEAEIALVSEGQAIPQLDKGGRPNEVTYFRKVNCSPENTQWRVNVTYDRRDKVWQITATGIIALYPRTPPDDRADRTIFDFADYKTSEELLKTLKAMFPKGTPRVDVEQTLHEWNVTTALVESNDANSVWYRHSYRDRTTTAGKSTIEDRVWTVRVDFFKDDDTVSQLSLDGSAIRRAFSGAESRDYYLKKNKRKQPPK